MPTTTSIEEVLTELQTASNELMDLGRIAGLIGWDQETMMPSGGGSYRAAQRATLEGIIHERLTSPRLAKLLDQAEEAAARGKVSDTDRAFIREFRRDRDHAAKLPNAFVKEMAQASSEGVESWRRAYDASRWDLFEKDLERIIELKRREAEYIGYAETAYDALLDEYEPGMTTSRLVPILKTLRAETVKLLDRLNQAPREPDRSLVERHFDVFRQRAFGEMVLRSIGFDFQHGRQDVSTHPFTSAFGPGDVRITTRYNERDIQVGLLGSVHEAGHGTYEQGIDESISKGILGTGVSLGIHESQSRLWENFIARGLPFWRGMFPRLRATFPDQLAGVNVEDFVFALNRVTPSFVRVEADEVTYNLHVILRFEIERQLLSRDVSVKDLPSFWNESMKDMFGITPTTMREGVLQDIHWAFGLYGYFPTYTLGNLYGAQLWAALRRETPDLDARLEAGDFAVVLNWMRERIHRHGRIYQPVELIRRATGEEPNPSYLTAYLNEKYGALYGI